MPLIKPACVLAAIALLAGAAPVQAQSCFTASKTYLLHPLHGGADLKNGWAVQGDDFAQCVHHAEAAEKDLHRRYPPGDFGYALAATVGCHAPCGS